MRTVPRAPRFAVFRLAVVGLLVMVPGLLSACLPPSSGAPPDSPDPFVVHYGGAWYLFSTATVSNGILYDVPVWSSTDEQTWHFRGDALPPSLLPPWASRYNSWAPAVLQRADGIWVLYVSLDNPWYGHHVVAVATARSPVGPYDGRPYLPLQAAGSAREPTHGAIDPSPVAYGGHEYLLWKSDVFPPSASSPTRIWARQLGSDLLDWAAGSREALLLTSRAGWQGYIIEAPAMWPTLVGSYLFYSGGWYQSSGYAIGWARCPAGPTAGCADMSPSQPWLGTFGGAYGPGGEEVARGDAPPQLAFHAWTNATAHYPSANRRLWIAGLHLDSNWRPTLS